MADIKSNVKAILGIEDTLQDKVIDIIIKNVQSHLKIWLKQHADMDSIPSELDFIVEEMAISRFQKLGSEGMASESVEGRSVTYNEDDFNPYRSILETYIPRKERRGKVIFY